MPSHRGYKWALVASAALHLIAFLTIPMGGKVGEVRQAVYGTIKRTAVKFVRVPKPPAKPELKPAPSAKTKVRPAPRRRVRVRRPPRIRRRPRTQRPQLAAGAPVQRPALEILPPKPTGQPAERLSEPEPEPVVIQPVPTSQPSPPVKPPREPERVAAAPAPEPDMSTEVSRATPEPRAPPRPVTAPAEPRPPLAETAVPVKTQVATGPKLPSPTAPSPTEAALASSERPANQIPSPVATTAAPGAKSALPSGPPRPAPSPGATPPLRLASAEPGGAPAQVGTMRYNAGGAPSPPATSPQPLRPEDAGMGPAPAEAPGAGSSEGAGLPGKSAPQGPLRLAHTPGGREGSGSGWPRGGGRAHEYPGGPVATRPGGAMAGVPTRGTPSLGVPGQPGNLPGWTGGGPEGTGGGARVARTRGPASPPGHVPGQGRGPGSGAGPGPGGGETPGAGDGGPVVIVLTRGGGGGGPLALLMPSAGGRGPGGSAELPGGTGGGGLPGKGGLRLAVGSPAGPPGGAPGGRRASGFGEGPESGAPVAVAARGGGGGYGAPGLPVLPGSWSGMALEAGPGEGSGSGQGPGRSTLPSLALASPSLGFPAPGLGGGSQAEGPGGIEGPEGGAPVVIALVGEGGGGGDLGLPPIAGPMAGGLGEAPGEGGMGWPGAKGSLGIMAALPVGPLLPGATSGQAGQGLVPGEGGPVPVLLAARNNLGGFGLAPLPMSEPRPGGVLPITLAPGESGPSIIAKSGQARVGLYAGIVGSFDMPMGITTSDYQTDAEGMANLLAEVRKRTKVHVTVQERFVPLRLDDIKDTPVLHLRGHRPFSFTPQERETLRQYVAQGGTIVGEDSHGPFGECFRREMRQIFGRPLRDLPLDHELYRAHYVLDSVPAGDMGERYPLQGIDIGGRLGVIFSRNDYGDCWEGTGGWVKPESREPAFQMGTNIMVYIAAHWQKTKQQAPMKR